MGKKFIHLKRVNSLSELDPERKYVVVHETNNPIGIGSRICDMMLESGKIIKECLLEITKNQRTKEAEIFVNSNNYSDETLKKVKFCLSNLDF